MASLLSMRSTAFVNKQGSGYAQFVFNIQCECGQSITKEVLGAAKFAQDMARDHKNPNTLETHGSGVYLAYVGPSDCGALAVLTNVYFPVVPCILQQASTMLQLVVSKTRYEPTMLSGVQYVNLYLEEIVVL